MGKKRFNVKGRRKVETIIDNTEVKKIELDFESKNEDEYKTTADDNLLVLPSKKRATKIRKEATVTKILSRKQRKRLEKIVEKKKKKENRASLIEALASVQIPASELKQYTKLTSVQTKGLKKHFHEQKFGTKEKRGSENTVNENDKAGSTVRGVKRTITIDDSSENEEVPKKIRDYNVIGVNQSDSESESDEEMQESETRVEEKAEVKEPEDPVAEIKDPVEISKDPVKANEVPKHLPVEKKPATYIHVERDQEIQIARLKLPIIAEEQVIMETISENTVIILAGSTGSGKTTQVPQFLYEAGYAENGKIIGVTEPRRVAAISMSKRVGREMNLSTDIVSYLIRFEGNCTPETKIKFMTDGVLLKEVESDFLLLKYSVIILDEAHERSAYTDILIGLLSRIIQLRNKKGNPLKLIIMSATLRVEDFTKNLKLFKEPPPVINVESRQFPVTVHFNKVTAEDYAREALIKTIKIHTKLPEGGILVFLTGQQEVKYLVNKLRKLFPFYGNKNAKKEEIKTESEQQLDYSDDEELDQILNIRKAIKHQKKNKKNLISQMTLPKVNLDDFQMPGDDTEADFNEDQDMLDENFEEQDEIDEKLNEMMTGTGNSQPLWVLPLYSLLPSHKQARVFEPPPEGTRLCVVSTNVAETSLTIPDVKYVVDSGRQKTKFYDKVTGVNAFVVTFTSKAAADQRAGRAGRVAPGHCYRLYSSAVYSNQFVQFSPPEIQEKPIDGLVLQMKAMGIEKVINFPFPSPPDRVQLEVAEKRLKILGALDNQEVSKITKLGSSIASFPVNPRYGKMLALSHQQNLLEYTICIVAALSVQEVLQEVPLSGENGEKDTKWRTKRRGWAGNGNSLYLGDPMILLKAIGAAEYAHSQNKLQNFCDENGLRMKGVQEIRKLRVQLTNEVNLNVPNLSLAVNPKMEPPTDQQAKLLRQILMSGLGDQVARKIPDDEIKLKEDKHKFKHAYQIPDVEEPVFMHSCSILKKKQPEWVIYQEIFETRNGDSTKMFIRGITAIEPEWLLKFAPALCNFTKTLEEPEPRYDSDDDKIYCHVKATFGRSGWELPIAEMEMPESLDKYRHFGRFLLEGAVFEKLAEFKKNLLSTPSTMIKSWSKLVPRTETMMNALANKQVDSRKKLVKELKENSNYLLKQYLMWVPEALQYKVTTTWSELLN
ncbi:hypothetical protein ACKWTF_012967 [Chironomus riparius]